MRLQGRSCLSQRIGAIDGSGGTIAPANTITVDQFLSATNSGAANTTLGNSFTIPDFGVVDLSAQRHLVGDIDLFVSVENVFDRPYYVTISGTATAPIYSLGLPRTVRVGLDLLRF